MGEQPLVSIIVPIYRTEKYVGDCVESIIGQTYRNLEIILVDDGSDDGCPQLCDEYAQQDSRVYVIHKKNGGPSSARNAGLNYAHGELIYFVDSDDMVHTDCIRNLVSIMEKEDCDIVQCRTYSFLTEKKIPLELPPEKHEIFTGKQMCNFLLFGHRYGSDTTVVWDKLYKRSLFNDLVFRERLIYEDVAIMHELMWKAGKVAVTNLPLAFYRSMREGSITHSGNKRFEDRIKADTMRLKFFKRQNEPKLVGQSYYILSNDMARLRVYKNDGGGLLKEKHRQVVQKSNQSNIPITKKALIHFSYYCPKLWFWIWNARRKISGKIRWRKKGEKV